MATMSASDAKRTTDVTLTIAIAQEEVGYGTLDQDDVLLTMVSRCIY